MKGLVVLFSGTYTYVHNSCMWLTKLVVMYILAFLCDKCIKNMHVIYGLLILLLLYQLSYMCHKDCHGLVPMWGIFAECLSMRYIILIGGKGAYCWVWSMYCNYPYRSLAAGHLLFPINDFWPSVKQVQHLFRSRHLVTIVHLSRIEWQVPLLVFTSWVW